MDVHGAPVFRNLVLVLGDPGLAGVRGPVGGGRVVERDVDMRVVLDLVALGRHAVRNEHERDLVVLHCCQHEHGGSAQKHTATCSEG